MPADATDLQSAPRNHGNWPDTGRFARYRAPESFGEVAQLRDVVHERNPPRIKLWST